MNPLSIIVCGTPRSGSYYLLDLMHRYGLPMGDEWLTPFHQGSRKWQYGQKSSLPYIEYLRMISDRERRSGLFVLKLLAPQFPEFKRELMAMEAPSETTLSKRIESIFPNPRYIYLTREDKIAQAVSHVKARQTRHWVKRAKNDAADEARPVYSYLAVAKQLADRERNEERWEEFFREERLDVFRIVFDSLLKDPESHMRSLFSWLGIEPLEPVAEKGKPHFRKMADSLNDDWITRFNEDREICDRVQEVPGQEQLESLNISRTSLGTAYEVGGDCRFTVTVSTGNSPPPPFRGLADGTGWLRIVGSLKGEGIEEWFQQELRPHGEGEFQAECVLPTPKAPGPSSLKLVVSDRLLDHPAVWKQRGLEHRVEFVHAGPRGECRKLFSDIRDMPNGWQFLPWFGYFLDDKFPWIYHADHEWLFVKNQATENNKYHILDANLGWLEIDPASYPVLLSLKSGKQWRFVSRDKGTRTFQDLESGESFSAETNRPEHLRKLNT